MSLVIIDIEDVDSVCTWMEKKKIVLELVLKKKSN